MRHALNVVGLVGGQVGPGIRNSIPARGSALINIRLVRDQDPDHVARMVRRHIDGLVPDGLRSRVTVLSSTRATTVSIGHPAGRCAREALTQTFGRHPAVLYSGGSIPAVGMVQDKLGAVPILMGFGLPDDNAHGPNEKVHVPTLLRGVDAVCGFLTRLGHFSAPMHCRSIRS